MKKLHFYFCIVAICALIGPGKAWSQISFTENFEDGSADGWSDPDQWYYVDIPFGTCSNYMAITFLYSDYAGMEAAMISPSTGISNGGEVTLTYDYKLVSYSVPGVPLQNEPDWGVVKVEYATSASGPWTSIDEVTPANHVASTDCATRTASFTPEAGSTIYLRVDAVVSDSPGIDAMMYIDNISVTQAPPCTTPAPNDLAATQTLCSNSNIGDLDIGNYDTILWYNAAAGGTPLASATLVGNNTYYAAQFDGGCESIQRKAVTVTLNVTEVPEAQATQQFCNAATVGDLEAEGSGLKWYAGPTGGPQLAGTTPLTDEAVYYVSQEVAGCESARIPVTVGIFVTGLPDVGSPQVFEDSMPIVVQLYDIDVDAAGTVKWYATQENAEDGDNALPENTEVTESGTYYVTQIIGECESAPVEVVIDIILGNDAFGSGSFSYYPNPVTDRLTLSYSQNIIAVSIYNMLGQQVASKKVNGNEAVIDMASLSGGTYIVKVATDNASKIIRIMKQ